uniref:ensconsin-like n=1 Tax=Myxine glutinosa TaxID=7769 RepID=UPI00358E1826
MEVSGGLDGPRSRGNMDGETPYLTQQNEVPCEDQGLNCRCLTAEQRRKQRLSQEQDQIDSSSQRTTSRPKRWSWQGDSPGSPSSPSSPSSPVRHGKINKSLSSALISSPDKAYGSGRGRIRDVGMGGKWPEALRPPRSPSPPHTPEGGCSPSSPNSKRASSPGMWDRRPGRSSPGGRRRASPSTRMPQSPSMPPLPQSRGSSGSPGTGSYPSKPPSPARQRPPSPGNLRPARRNSEKHRSGRGTPERRGKGGRAREADDGEAHTPGVEGRVPAGTTDPEEAARALAENRRLMREQREREELERQKREEEEKQALEEAFLRAAEERARRAEEARVQEALAAKERALRRRQEEAALFEQQRLREEAEARAQEEAERQREERERLFLKEEQERFERKKRLEEIMKRTRKPSVDRKSLTPEGPKEDTVTSKKGEITNGDVTSQETRPAGADAETKEQDEGDGEIVGEDDGSERAASDEETDDVQSMDVSPVSKDEGLSSSSFSPLRENAYTQPMAPGPNSIDSSSNSFHARGLGLRSPTGTVVIEKLVNLTESLVPVLPRPMSCLHPPALAAGDKTVVVSENGGGKSNSVIIACTANTMGLEDVSNSNVVGVRSDVQDLHL